MINKPTTAIIIIIYYILSKNNYELSLIRLRQYTYVSNFMKRNILRSAAASGMNPPPKAVTDYWYRNGQRTLKSGKIAKRIYGERAHYPRQNNIVLYNILYNMNARLTRFRIYGLPGHVVVHCSVPFTVEVHIICFWREFDAMKDDYIYFTSNRSKLRR